MVSAILGCVIIPVTGLVLQLKYHLAFVMTVALTVVTRYLLNVMTFYVIYDIF